MFIYLINILVFLIKKIKKFIVIDEKEMREKERTKFFLLFLYNIRAYGMTVGTK